MAKINISINSVKQAMTDLMTDGTIDQAGADILLWYYSHCQSQGWSQKQASREINKNSWSTLYRVWQGKYGAGYDQIIKDIERVKTIHEQRSKLAGINYIETSVYQTVADVCTNALIGQEISTINGNTQIGKTAAIKHYIKQNPDMRIVYFETPSCPCKSLFFGELGAACYVTQHSNTNQLRKSIKAAFDSKTLLIIDEFHQVFLGSDKAAVAIVEFIRELYNHAQCGVVLVGTNVLDDNLRKGRHHKIFAQTLKRGLIHAQLPDKTPGADIRLAIERYAFPVKIAPDARKMIDQINTDHGLGIILKAFKAGATLAKKQDSDPTWDHLIEAWTILQRLSQKQGA